MHKEDVAISSVVGGGQQSLQKHKQVTKMAQSLHERKQVDRPWLSHSTARWEAQDEQSKLGADRMPVPTMDMN
jgi:hypothetical protein